VSEHDHAPFEAQLRCARLYQDVAETLLVATGRRPHSPAGDLWHDPLTGHVEPAHRLVPQARSEAKFSPILQGFERFLSGCEEAQVRGRGWTLVELPRPSLAPTADGARGPTAITAPREQCWQCGVNGALRTLSHAAAICRAEVLREERERTGDAFVGVAVLRDGYDQREGQGSDDAQVSPADDVQRSPDDDVEVGALHAGSVAPHDDGGMCL